MRTYKSTLVTLDTFLCIPNRYLESNTALFVCGKTEVDTAVLIALKCADRKVVTLLLVNRLLKAGNYSRNV